MNLFLKLNCNVSVMWHLARFLYKICQKAALIQVQERHTTVNILSSCVGPLANPSDNKIIICQNCYIPFMLVFPDVCVRSKQVD